MTDLTIFLEPETPIPQGECEKVVPGLARTMSNLFGVNQTTRS